MAAEGMDLIVTTGGLGPTADDLTAEVVARFAGRELVLDEEMEAKIAEILRGFARSASDFDEEAVLEANRKQAMVPEGAIALDPVGTAPGLVVPAGGAGRDRPARPAARAAADVAGGAGDRAGAGGAGAGDAAARLHDADVRRAGVGDRQEPARDRGRRGRARTRSRSPPACAAARSRSTSATATRRATVAEAVRERAGRAPPRARPSASTARRSTPRSATLLLGQRLGLAESCSGGLLAARITDLPGASEYMAGGVVAYSNEAKAELLGRRSRR